MDRRPTLTELHKFNRDVERVGVVVVAVVVEVVFMGDSWMGNSPESSHEIIGIE